MLRQLPSFLRTIAAVHVQDFDLMFRVPFLKAAVDHDLGWVPRLLAISHPCQVHAGECVITQGSINHGEFVFVQKGALQEVRAPACPTKRHVMEVSDAFDAPGYQQQQQEEEEGGQGDAHQFTCARCQQTCQGGRRWYCRACSDDICG